MQQYFSYYTSPIGTLKLCCSDSALLSVHFDEGEREAPTDNNPILVACTKQLDEYFRGERKTFDLPLMHRGTDFQVQVWTLLNSIPYGKTVTYMHLAKQFGNIKAIRAVAAANGKNTLPIIVPCHRVIGSDAKLTGYLGGLWRKQWLLHHEANQSSVVQKSLF